MKTVLFLLLFICASITPRQANAWMPTSHWSKSLHLLAGSTGGTGNIDGVEDAARFGLPNSVAADSNGNVYVADTSNHTIRKVTSAGVVTTLAGRAGTSGSANGTGSAARFNSPNGVAVDAAGNVYVADTTNQLIRMITPAGVVTSLAGLAGTMNSTNGTGSAARFKNPNAVTVDATGNVYVADTGNHTIRKITSAGVVTTLAGNALAPQGSADGTGTIARFNFPKGIAVDTTGDLYVTDTTNCTIRRVTSAGAVTTVAGTVASCTNADGTGAVARFNLPIGIAVDSSGDVYVADSSNYTIRKVTSAAVVTTIAGTAGSSGNTNGTGSAARFQNTFGVTVDSGGNLFVADANNNVIRKISSAGVVTTFAGSVPAHSAGSADGIGGAARFNDPYGVAVDAAGNAYVTDTLNNTIRKITSAGVVTTFAGTVGVAGYVNGTGSAALFDRPRGIAIDAAGDIYVADTFNDSIRKITPAGVVTTFAGTGNPGSSNGTGTGAGFNGPSGLAFDSSGNLYVADTSNHAIRKITPAALVTTFVGSLTIGGSANGTGTAATFQGPRGVAVDAAGNVYIADSFNDEIRVATPARVVTTFAGSSAASPGTTDGTGAAARFYFPSGITVDSAGTLYVADQYNNLVRKITPAGVVTTVVGAVSILGIKPRALPAALSTGTDSVHVANGRLYIVSENAVLWCSKP